MRSIFIHFANAKDQRIYNSLLGPGDIAFDIGANLGQTTDKLLHVANRVIAVEPSAECVRELRKKYKNNAAITTVNKGVSDKDELLPFNYNETRSRTSSFIRGWNEEGTVRSYFIRTTTLDALIEEYGKPQFIKIDVEGFELRVLKGLTQKIPSLSFEYHGNTWDDTLGCIELIEKLGTAKYNYNTFLKHDLQLKNWVNAGELIRELREVIAAGHGYGDVFAKIE